MTRRFIINWFCTEGQRDLRKTSLVATHDTIFSNDAFAIILNDWRPHIVTISASLTHTRHRGFDLLRVLAIYMVMQIHTGEFEYIAPDGTVLHTAGSWAVGWTNSLLRVCVPLFVMITGFFFSHRTSANSSGNGSPAC
jgi:hypothetical protein